MPIKILEDRLEFPDHDQSQIDGLGLIAIGGDLSVSRLLLAYKNGIFPWYEKKEYPILWWSPLIRCIILPKNFHISRRFRQQLKKCEFSFTLDKKFTEVINSCARKDKKGRDNTWITPEMIKAYTNLFKSGYAHSIEIMQGDKLVGGLYGVCYCGIFYAESMFHTVDNSSKVALAVIVEIANILKLNAIDCQFSSDFLLSMGATNVVKENFLSLIDQYKPSYNKSWEFLIPQVNFNSLF